MLPFSKFEGFFKQPIHLTDEEIANPQLVFERFNEDYKLAESRLYIDQMLYVCLISNRHPFDEGRERASVWEFTSQLIKLIEAASIMRQSNTCLEG